MTTTRLAIAILLMTTILATGAPGTSASHCTDLLGPTEWVCHPNPDPHFELSECVQTCKTREVQQIEPSGIGPGMWHVLCDVPTLLGTFRIDQVYAGDSPDCLSGALYSVEGELVPAGQAVPEPGGVAGAVHVGLCELTIRAEVYGTYGVNDHTTLVSCASFS